MKEIYLYEGQKMTGDMRYAGFCKVSCHFPLGDNKWEVIRGLQSIKRINSHEYYIDFQEPIVNMNGIVIGRCQKGEAWHVDNVKIMFDGTNGEIALLFQEINRHCGIAPRNEVTEQWLERWARP